MASKLTILAATAASAIILTGCNTLRDRLPGSGSVKSSGNSVKAKEMPPQLGVNAFLWRASLETLDNMPTASVDPFGGVIITEWHAEPEAPGERLKVTAYILDTQLRADALKVSVFRQTGGAGGWTDAPVDADTARQLENAILTRARELYIASN